MLLTLHIPVTLPAAEIESLKSELHDVLMQYDFRPLSWDVTMGSTKIQILVEVSPIFLLVAYFLVQKLLNTGKGIDGSDTNQLNPGCSGQSEQDDSAAENSDSESNSQSGRTQMRAGKDNEHMNPFHIEIDYLPGDAPPEDVEEAMARFSELKQDIMKIVDTYNGGRDGHIELLSRWPMDGSNYLEEVVDFDVMNQKINRDYHIHIEEDATRFLRE